MSIAADSILAWANERDQVWHFGRNVSNRIFVTSRTQTGSALSFDPEFKRLFRLLYSKICQHLRDTGVLDRARVSYYDEPIYATTFNAEALLSLNALFFDVCPGVHLWQDKWPVPEVSATSQIYANLTRDVTQWLVDWKQYVAKGVPAQVARARHTAGAVTTMYDNAIPIIDLPWTRTRSFPWMIASTDVLGIFTDAGLQVLVHSA